jgi:hypothetical protein
MLFPILFEDLKVVSTMMTLCFLYVIFSLYCQRLSTLDKLHGEFELLHEKKVILGGAMLIYFQCKLSDMHAKKQHDKII